MHNATISNHTLLQESKDQQKNRFEELLNEIDQLNILIEIEKEFSFTDTDEQSQTSHS
jgi:hypothetical protein